MIEKWKQCIELVIELHIGCGVAIMLIMMFGALFFSHRALDISKNNSQENTTQTSDTQQCNPNQQNCAPNKNSYLYIILAICCVVMLLPFSSTDVLDVTKDKGFNLVNWFIQSVINVFNVLLISGLVTKFEEVNKNIKLEYKYSLLKKLMKGLIIIVAVALIVCTLYF